MSNIKKPMSSTRRITQGRLNNLYHFRNKWKS
nr:MAG TPA: hypothetical protein [Caudoviricetes sp.]